MSTLIDATEQDVPATRGGAHAAGAVRSDEAAVRRDPEARA